MDKVSDEYLEDLVKEAGPVSVLWREWNIYREEDMDPEDLPASRGTYIATTSRHETVGQGQDPRTAILSAAVADHLEQRLNTEIPVRRKDISDLQIIVAQLISEGTLKETEPLVEALRYSITAIKKNYD